MVAVPTLHSVCHLADFTILFLTALQTKFFLPLRSSAWTQWASVSAHQAMERNKTRRRLRLSPWLLA